MRSLRPSHGAVVLVIAFSMISASVSTQAETASASASNVSAVRVASSPSTPSPYSTEVLADQPTSYWRLNDAVTLPGSPVVDQTGANPGTISGPVTQGSQSPTGISSLSLSGNASIDLGSAPTLRPTSTPWTAEMWFKATAADAKACDNNFEGTQGSCLLIRAHAYGYNINLQTNGTVEGSVSADTTTGYSAGSTATYDDGKWHHIVLVRDTGSLTLFVDGSSIASTATPLSTTYTCCENNVALGNDPACHCTGFTGDLSEAAFYNSALPAARILVHFNVGQGGANSKVLTAYVANSRSNTVTALNTATNATTSIPVAGSPDAIAASPDGSTAYVANQSDDTVTPINTATNTTGTPIPVGHSPFAVAVTPDGSTVYTANYFANTVTPINTTTRVAAAPIRVGNNPSDLAVSPDGTTVYVADSLSGSLTPIHTATNTVGASIPVGGNPVALAITPDGTTAYVLTFGNNTVTPITLATGAIGTAISVGITPVGIAITPDGTTAYVVNQFDNTVTPITLATRTVGADISVGTKPERIAITPDGATAYVTNLSDGTVTPIDTAAKTSRNAISVGSGPLGIALALTQPLEPPVGVKVVSVGNGTVTLHWRAPKTAITSPVIGYRVFSMASDTGGSFPGIPVLQAFVGATQTSATLSELTQDCSTTYSFVVSAVSAAGASPSAPTRSYLPSGFPPINEPKVAVILLDGVPSSESGGKFYPLKVKSSAHGVGVVRNYCPATAQNKKNRYPTGLKESVWRWSEFPVGGATSGTACLDSNVATNCLTAALAGKDQAVLLPFSYTRATLTRTGSGDVFDMGSYNSCDSAGGPQCVSGGQPDQQRQALDAEISSIHRTWPSTKIVLIGHSYGGMLAEQWWLLFRPTYSDHDGVSLVYSLDSPINGIRNSLVAPFSRQIQNLWFALWNNLFTNGQNDKDILLNDPDGSYSAVGTPDDGTFGSIANGPNPPITSQLDFTVDANNDLFETSVDFQSPCSANATIVGTVYGHDTPKVCPEVIQGISNRIAGSG
jgi:YVTN family beta-propeller protein